MEIASLSKTARGLLLAYLTEGPPFTTQTIEEQMAKIGVVNRGVFLSARAELRGVGVDFQRNGRRGTLTLSRELLLALAASLLDWWGCVTPIPSIAPVLRGDTLTVEVGEGGVALLDKLYSYRLLEGVGSGPQSGLNGRVITDVRLTGTSDIRFSGTSDVRFSGTSENPESDVRFSGTSEVRLTGTSDVMDEHDVRLSGTSDITPTISDVRLTGTSAELESLLLLDRCISVDELDDTGPENKASSPFGVRRAKQVALVQGAWKEIFPQDAYPLSRDNAKAFLSWCGNSAETCYERLQDIAHRKPGLDHPVSYVRKALPGWSGGAKSTAPKAPLTTSTVGWGGDTWDGEYIEVSEAYKEKARKAKEQIKARFGEDYG